MEVLKNIFDNLGITEFARPSLGISDILDILIVAYIIYKIIFWIKETRAWVLFKGILVIFALAAVAMLLKLNTILWILSNTISVGIIAVIVVFHRGYFPDEHDSMAGIQIVQYRCYCIGSYLSAGTAKGTGAAGQRKILHRLRQKL